VNARGGAAAITPAPTPTATAAPSPARIAGIAQRHEARTLHSTVTTPIDVLSAELAVTEAHVRLSAAGSNPADITAAREDLDRRRLLLAALRRELKLNGMGSS